jgi:AraC family transcriptional regulator
MATIRFEFMRPSRPTELTSAHSCDEIICLVGRSEPSTAAVDAGFYSVWIALKGSLRLELPDGTLNVPVRNFFLGNGDTPLHGSGEGGWTLLAIPKQSPWLRTCESANSGLADLLSIAMKLDRTLLRAVVRLLRGSHDASVSPWFQRLLFRDVIHALNQSQHRLKPLLERCPGRTDEQRRLTLSRLLRVRQAYELRREEPFSVEKMAELAHYSPCHFIRVFQQVFRESPLDFMIAARMRHARVLLEDTELAITEISHRLGYTSSATFARVFKAYHGHTASEARGVIRSRRSQRGGDAVLPRGAERMVAARR